MYLQYSEDCHCFFQEAAKITVKILSAKPPVIKKDCCNIILQCFFAFKKVISFTFEDKAHKLKNKK
jgi:hypothetical protein